MKQLYRRTVGGMRTALDFVVPRRYRLLVVVNVALYFIIIFGVLIGIVSEGEWNKGTVSRTFLITVITLPPVGLGLGFLLNYILLLHDQDEKQRQDDANSHILRTIHGSRPLSLVSRALFDYLMSDWLASVESLRNGSVALYKDYWKVCGELHDLADRNVESTSVIPLCQWAWQDGDQSTELRQYYEEQKTYLIGKGVAVNRTFILKVNDLTEPDFNHFALICNRQLRDGFHLYFIDLDNIPPSERNAIHQDFSLIDTKLLMKGKIPTANVNVYSFDFYDLRRLREKHNVPLDVLALFKDGIKFYDTRTPELKILEYRRPVSEFSKFDVVSKQSIIDLVAALKYS